MQACHSLPPMTWHGFPNFILSSTYASAYATISGTIFFSDGQTPVQGVNVIARQANNPNTAPNESSRIAVSVVSGYRFTANPGQSVTANYLPCTPPGQNGCPASGFADRNTGGSQYGSRNAIYYGSYDIPVPAQEVTPSKSNPFISNSQAVRVWGHCVFPSQCLAAFLNFGTRRSPLTMIQPRRMQSRPALGR